MSSFSVPAKKSATDLEEFALFPELPKELRLQIWEHTLETRPRVVRMHLQMLDRPQLRCTIGGDPNPVALSVCHESRELASETYEPLLHDYPPNNFLGLIPNFPSFTRVKFSGFRYMRFNFATDKFVFGRSERGLPIEHESPDRFEVAPNLSKLAQDFPNLRRLDYILNTATPHPEATMDALLKKGEGSSHLVPLDSNLTDLLFYQQQKQGQGLSDRFDPINSLLDLAFDIREASMAKAEFRDFMSTLDTSRHWTKLKNFETFFQVVRNNRYDLHSIIQVDNDTERRKLRWVVPPYVVRFENLNQLLRERENPYDGYESGFPCDRLATRTICDQDGEMFSRYDGMEELFRED
ncbi:uncharacterized protein PAC_07665 [Phialocephala subalpina]|uniref:2EXR domain-containing protein n=1 Tax=Phialocephala subalpina TaxID=576137 RepID=A0A1L7WYD0_9HELO|nr:uncharacterized protein PAC_07665 [Phialocephala subalpina]